jgi:hypothetical protein
VQAEIEVLQETKQAIRQGGNALPDNYPDTAHDLVASVQEARRWLDGEARRDLLNSVNEAIDDRIDELDSKAIDESADKLSQTIDEELDELVPLVSGSPAEIKERLLVKSAPEFVKPSRWRANLGPVTLRIPIPKFHPPDILLGALLALLLVLAVTVSGLIPL